VETLIDIAIGNRLNRLRSLWACPMIAHIEQIAKKGGSKLLTLPYIVKGMDVRF